MVLAKVCSNPAPRTLTVLHQCVCCFGIFGKSSKDKFSLPDKFDPRPSEWVELMKIATEHRPLDLGLGVPNFPPPDYVTKALAEVAKSDKPQLQQYTRNYGHPRLVNALSTLYSKFKGCDIMPLTEILVTYGAHEALYSAIVGHTSPGDRIIIIEPCLESYAPMVIAAGGKPVFVPLRLRTESGTTPSSKDWVLDECKLKSAFTKKTKAIILNTPHNPIGKVFSMEELTAIADLCKKWNVLCIADEVYEWMVFGPEKHIRMCSLPDMWDRTITIGSAGKTFSVTGWKTGWAYGPEPLMKNLFIVHQNSVYVCITPIQEAVAKCFEHELKGLDSPESYFRSLAKELSSKRDFMVEMLTNAGMTPTIPDGGYYLTADWSKLADKVDLDKETDKYRDQRFARWMVKNVGLQGIPSSTFYSEGHKMLAENYIRYCFIKTDETLEAADKILKKWVKSSSRRTTIALCPKKSPDQVVHK